MEASVSLPWQWKPTKRMRAVDDKFFEEGYEICCSAVKQIPIEEEKVENVAELCRFPCSMSGCSTVLDSILSYETHYNSVHRHVCSECKRIFPTNHLLEIHLLESHDPLFQLQSGVKFVCLVQGCNEKFVSAKLRKNHLVKIHKYPAQYRFNRSRVKKGATTCRTTPAGDNASVPCVGKENMTNGSAKRVFSHKVPQSICFGLGSARGFYRPRGRRKVRHWHQTNMEVDTTVQIENVDMSEIGEALG